MKKMGPFGGADLDRATREFPPKDCPIGVPRTIIAAESIANIMVHPQVLYKPRRLVVDRSYPDLSVVDLKVGHVSQLMAAGPFPLDALLPSPELERLNELLGRLSLNDPDETRERLLRETLDELKALRGNLGTVDKCQPGWTITIALCNNSPRTVDFAGAMLLGDCMAFDADGKAIA